MLLVFALAGCLTTWTHAGLEPAELPLPPGVQRVAVVDRTQAGEGEPAVAGFSGAALERGGLVLVDADTVAAALEGDAAALRTGPVGPESALAACARTGAQALVTAWRVEPDPFWNFERVGPGSWVANYNARSGVSFRVWDCAGRRLHDLTMEGWHTVSATGGDRPAARSAVPPVRRSDADRAAVAEAGRALAERLVPRPVTRTRPLFQRGPLRAGVGALRAGRLEDAATIFASEAATLDPRRRARALHDLAVVAEALGELDVALEHVAEALVLDPHPATLALRASLMRRLVVERPARP